MKTILPLLGGAVFGVVGVFLWLAWYFRNVFR